MTGYRFSEQEFLQIMNSTPKNKDRNRKDARDTRAEALKIANSQHVEGQTKEQTRLIAKGIQKGIEQFLRQQNEKVRDLDRRTKKVQQLLNTQGPETATITDDGNAAKKSPFTIYLPWILLGCSWIIFLAYVLWLS